MAYVQPKMQRLLHARQLAELCARLDIPLGDTTSPGQLATLLDPMNSVQRPHLEVIDNALTHLLATPQAQLMIWTPSQVGKLVAHDTPVPTPTGWTTHGELRPGDEVYHPSGKVVSVRAVSADATASVRVSTSDGGSVVVHPRHEWTVWDRNWKRWATMETGDMMRRAYVDRSGRPAFMLPHRDALEGVSSDLPIDPYTLGVWLGDGSSTKAAITHHANDHYDLPYPESANCVHATTGVVTTYYRGGLHTALKALGVHGNKHIPQAYLRAAETDRRALLAGLIDSDGTIAKSGQVSFVNTNRRLYDGVVELIRTLGYRATVHTPLQPSTSSSGVVGTRVLYRVSFTPWDGIAPARLPRKAAMSDCTGRRRRVAITGIEPVDPQPGRCIEVDSPDGLYLVGEHMIATHNSTRVSTWFPFWWMTRRPRDRILNASAEERLARRNGAAVRELVREHGAAYGLNLVADEGSKTDWSIRAGGSMRSRGLRGNFTGQPLDLGIIDDPITSRAQAESLQQRDFVWDWYSSVWSQRKAPTYREVIVMCLTGDTRVLMADGTERAIRDVRPGDCVATYEGGELATSTVRNWANQGSDATLEVRMKSGRTVRGNARHPFRVINEKGVGVWVRLASLRAGMRVRCHEEPGRAPHARSSRAHTQQKSCRPPLDTWTVGTDEVVEVVDVGYEDVFDVEVERTHNFVANGLEVSNTRWHEDDLAGRLLARDGRVEDGGKWIVVHLPAIALAPDPLRGIYDDPLGRKPGEPLTHPLIEPDDVDALVEWWAQKRAMSTARDWAAMSQGVPSDATTALLSEAAIRTATAPAPARADLRRVAVAVDPSGGEGEKHDTAGIGVVGLDADGKAWVLDDRTAVLSPLEWPRRVCEVAAEHDAGTIVYEKNYGGGMTKVLVQQAWAELQRERADAIAAAGDDPLAVEAAEQVGIAGDRNCPHIKGVTGRVSKVLRAEPIAQAVLTGRVKFARDADLTTLTNEWRLWQPGSTWSPGALDANVYGLTEVLPPVESRTKVTRPSGGRQQGARGSAQFAGRRRTA